MGEYMGRSPEDEPLTLTRYHIVGCHSYMKPLGGNLSMAKTITKRA